MSNGISQSEDRSYWSEVLTPSEWAEVVWVLSHTDASVRLFFAGTGTANRPSRDRAAGFLVAVAGTAGGLPDGSPRAEAVALLNKWVKRDPQGAKHQFPREARGAGE